MALDAKTLQQHRHHYHRQRYASALFTSTSTVVTSAATWSATDKNANVAISGAGLIATDTSGVDTDHCGRGTTATTLITTGMKRFWKIQVNVFGGTNLGVGLCTAAYTFTDGKFLGDASGSLSIGWDGADGSVFFNSGAVANFGIFGAGAALTIAVSKPLGKMWGAVNGVFSGDPVAGTGGVDISTMGDCFPAYDLKSTGAVTATFAATGGPTGYSIFP
jgi:hypothetical protein